MRSRVPAGPVRGEAGLVALGEDGLSLVPGETELRALQRVVHAQQQVALLDPRPSAARQLERRARRSRERAWRGGGP